MRRLNIVGVKSSTGIGNAFDAHARALLATTEGTIFDAREKGTLRYDETYVHGLPKLTEVFNRNYNSFGGTIAYWVWESSKVNGDFGKYVNSFKEIWTCSEYCKRVLEPLGRPVKVVPHYASRYCYIPERSEVSTFLLSFDGGSKILRKNPAFGAEAFYKAFGDSRKVKLIIKARNVGDALLSWVVNSAKTANIEVIDKDLTQVEMDNLYKRIDFLLSPHMSEGFGLHILEAMAFGKIPIVSAWGGSTEYVNASNGFPIECDEVAVSDDHYLGTWGSPKLDATVDQLRAAARSTSTMNKSAFDTALDMSFQKCVRDTFNALYE